MIVSIEGNIGSGKTTQCKLLRKDYLHWDVKTEPVQEWEAWLNEFYKDQSCAFGLEMKIMMSQMKYEEQPYVGANLCRERSAFSSKHVFVQNMYDYKLLSDLEFSLYNEFYTRHCQNPNYFIYIQTDPEICHQRVMSRNRPSESNLSLDYLKNMHKRHNHLFLNRDDTFIVDGNESSELVHEKIKKILDTII